MKFVFKLSFALAIALAFTATASAQYRSFYGRGYSPYRYYRPIYTAPIYTGVPVVGQSIYSVPGAAYGYPGMYPGAYPQQYTAPQQAIVVCPHCGKQHNADGTVITPTAVPQVGQPVPVPQTAQPLPEKAPAPTPQPPIPE